MIELILFIYNIRTYIYISFTGTVFANHVLCRNNLCRPYPSQELSLQTMTFSGTVFTNDILHVQTLSFQNANLLNTTVIYVNMKPSLTSCRNHVAVLVFADNFLKLVITFPKHLC